MCCDPIFNLPLNLKLFLLRMFFFGLSNQIIDQNRLTTILSTVRIFIVMVVLPVGKSTFKVCVQIFEMEIH